MRACTGVIITPVDSVVAVAVLDMVLVVALVAAAMVVGESPSTTDGSFPVLGEGGAWCGVVESAPR